MRQIDARGLACPQPVILAQKALAEHPEGIEVLVDHVTAKINLERFARVSGYTVECKEQEAGQFLLRVVS